MIAKAIPDAEAQVTPNWWGTEMFSRSQPQRKEDEPKQTPSHFPSRTAAGAVGAGALLGELSI